MSNGYTYFLSWFYSQKKDPNSTFAKAPARNWPYQDRNIKEASPAMIALTQDQLDSAISKLRHITPSKRIVFDPMNDMVEELHSVFKIRKLGIYSPVEKENFDVL